MVEVEGEIDVGSSVQSEKTKNKKIKKIINKKPSSSISSTGGGSSTTTSKKDKKPSSASSINHDGGGDNVNGNDDNTKGKSEKVKKVKKSTGDNKAEKTKKKKKSSSSSTDGGGDDNENGAAIIDATNDDMVVVDDDEAIAKAGGGKNQHSPPTQKKIPTTKSNTKRVDGRLQYDKLWNNTARDIANADVEEEVEEECALQPIPPPNNPPSDFTITLILKRPDLKQLKMLRVDPANTNIRMVREFLQKEYYKNHIIPRSEQRQLLYRGNPIFDETMDPNIDDAKTLEHHGIVQDSAIIELSKMHVYVISPSTQKSMMINNIDPMSDVIFDMKKLALEDGYPVDGLRLLHKEAGDKEITKDRNNVTFFDCGVKHEHTLILEWPQIVLKIKIPVVSTDSDDGQDEQSNHGNGVRQFEVIDFKVQAEIDTVNKAHDFIQERTGIPNTAQSLLWTNSGKAAGGKKKQPSVKSKPLSIPSKILADYKVQENDVIELQPLTVKVNLIGAGGSTAMVLDDIFPHDTIGYIKDRIEMGGRQGKGVAGGDGDDDDFPSILKTNQSLYKHSDGMELRKDHQTLHDVGISNGDELDVEKTKITIKVQLPGKEGKIVEIGVNPKLDDVETIKDLLGQKTGMPKEFFPPLSFAGNRMNSDGPNSNKKLVDYGLAENDVVDMEPMTLMVNVDEGDNKKVVQLDGIDPFNDTIDDIKRRLGPDELDLLPVDKQRLRFNDKDLDGDVTFTSEDEDVKKKKKKKRSSSTPTSPSSRKIFDCNIKHMDTLDLEKSKIDIAIRQPNGECLDLTGVDPRKDTIERIHHFVSDEYYHGKDKDGTIPGDKLRPLLLEGKPMEDATMSLRDYGLTDDGRTIQLEPMSLRVNVGSTEDDANSGKVVVLNGIDPMNDNIHDVVQQGSVGMSDVPSSSLILLHKEAQMKEIEEVPGKPDTFYVCGVNHGDTLVVRRKPVTIRVKLPKGSNILDQDNEDGNVKVVYDDDDDGTPILAIRVNPDKADYDTIRQHVLDHVGVPILSQRLNKLQEVDSTSDVGDEDGMPKNGRIDVPGDTKLSAPELNLFDGCTIELEPMTINVKTDKGKVVSLPVLPSDTVADVKRKLADEGSVRIPADKQRLLTEDGKEIGGDKDNEGSLGTDQSTLLELGIGDGDTLSVEKSKISLTVKMPHGMDDVEVVVDPKNGNVDQIRQLICDATGIPKGHQQRLTLADSPMDEGYPTKDGDKDDCSRERISLSKFNLKEFDCITLEPPRLFLLQCPEKQQYVIANINLMTCTVQDLKKRVAAATQLPTFKQRLLNAKTDTEMEGNKDSIETLNDHGIMDGDWVHVEKNRIDLRIILPALNELELIVDPRKDDLQKVRDYVFKKYYNKRVVPQKDLRSMLVRSQVVIDDEPGERKLVEFGICRDRDTIRLKASSITIDTPRRVLFCPNADIFHDNLDTIKKLVEKEGISTKGMYIEFNKEKITDYKSVLYDLNITDDCTVNFLQG